MKQSKLTLTAKEAHILWDCAGNMKDDFMDYYSEIHGKSKAEKMYKDFESGMNKLFEMWNRNKKSTQ